MSKFRAACVQLRSSEDVALNIQDASRLIRDAASGGAQFVATPENTTLMAADGEKMRARHDSAVLKGIGGTDFAFWRLTGAAF